MLTYQGTGTSKVAGKAVMNTWGLASRVLGRRVPLRCHGYMQLADGVPGENDFRPDSACNMFAHLVYVSLRCFARNGKVAHLMSSLHMAQGVVRCCLVLCDWIWPFGPGISRRWLMYCEFTCCLCIRPLVLNVVGNLLQGSIVSIGLPIQKFAVVAGDVIQGIGCRRV